MPTEKARPPSVMRLEVRPTRPMTMKVTRKVKRQREEHHQRRAQLGHEEEEHQDDEQPALEERVRTVRMHASMSEVRS